jgi:ribulose-phosphate 3-epimerase
MLKCATSLWSADLANLASEIKRVEPYSDRFHIDVADGEYVDALLFFPDLVKALRPHTVRPFEVHLITRAPLRWLDRFVEAGADSIIFYYDTAPDPGMMIKAIKQCGVRVGISLRVEDSVELLEPYWDRLDVVTLLGTHMGVKGAAMDAALPGKIAQARARIDALGVATEIEADGGIRYATIPLIEKAGAHIIVPGSVMFGDGPERLARFLAEL